MIPHFGFGLFQGNDHFLHFSWVADGPYATSFGVDSANFFSN
jgi:hypothetical protein